MENEIKKNRLSVTVGIPTCYGGLALPTVVKSIRASVGAEIDNILIISDRKPIPAEIRGAIEKIGAKIVWNEIDSSHQSKLKQMIFGCETDVLVTICDDIILHPSAIAEIMKVFSSDENITLVTSAILPLPSLTFIGKVLNSSVRIPEMIVRFWNKGDNYLSVSGRCMSFKVDFIKKLRFPPNIVSNDQFFYFENKYNGGGKEHAPKSIAYIRPPQNLKDHIRPSTRFQLGMEELQDYFSQDLSREFKVPMFAGIKAVVLEFLAHPITMPVYCLIFIYTRIIRKDKSKILTVYWDEALSTKKI